MDFFVQQFVNGLTLGLIYALVAIGFSLFFGVLDLVHFAHGDVAMFGAYLGLTTYLSIITIGVHSSIVLLVITLAVSIIGTCILGVAIERFVIRPLNMNNAPGPIILLGTVGVTMIIRESIRIFYPQGSSAQAFPGFVSNKTLFALGSISINANRIFIWVSTLIVFYIVHLIINHTIFGIHLRAVAQNRESVAMMGVNINKTIVYTFVLGSALAA
ncbi:MAG: branched-chain amino acid ABC transporter permease, partial [Firmicutes bacterium]|nr:branched-chain amino acid ABC transporter permease [Bacillota bacterium]